MAVAHYNEGAFGMISGSPYAVLEKLRQEGLRNSGKVVGLTTPDVSTGDILVMFFNGSKNISSDMLNWLKFEGHTDGVIDDSGTLAQKALLVSGASVSGTSVTGTTSGVLWLSGVLGAAYVDSFAHVALSGIYASTDGGTVVTSGIADSTTENLLTQQGTVCAWIKRVGEGKDDAIYDYSSAESGVAWVRIIVGNDNRLGYEFKNFWDYGLGQDKVGCGYGDGGAGTVSGVRISGTTAVTKNVWHHVAVTSDGSKIKLYVDGEKEPEDTYLQISGTNAGQWYGDINVSGTFRRTIGASITGVSKDITTGPGFDAQFYGYVDDFRILDYPLTEDQIRQLYRSKDAKM